MLATMTGIDDRQLLSPDLVCDSATFTEMSWLGMVFGYINTDVKFQRTLLPLKGVMKNISK